MKIDAETCIGCQACLPYCPVQAIETVERGDKPLSRIDQDRCVECGVCLRADVCPTGAIYLPELKWPRLVREAFSNPVAPHRGSKEMGRGTEEMKTNDVTGLFPHGVVGLAVEMGRPGVGTSFRDVQTMALALAREKVSFAPQNPVTNLMVDPETGELESEVLEERALSAIIEFHIPRERLPEILSAIRAATGSIDTVYSLDLITRLGSGAHARVLEAVRAAGFTARPNNKTNVGLGRPLKQEA